MKYCFLLLSLFISASVQAQNSRWIDGVVKNGGMNLENVHIRNISSGKSTISAENGGFQLAAQPGDTLVLSHVAMQDLIKFLSEEDVQQENLVLQMTEKANELDEVDVGGEEEVTAVSVGIISHRPRRLSVNERRLRTAGDFKPTHLLGIIGGGLNLDAVLNAINGRTKKLKRNIEIEKQQQQMAFLEIHYSDYLKNEMALNDQEIQFFLDYLVHQEQLAPMIKAENDARMKFFLQDSWLKFQEEVSSED